MNHRFIRLLTALVLSAVLICAPVTTPGVGISAGLLSTAAAQEIPPPERVFISAEEAALRLSPDLRALAAEISAGPTLSGAREDQKLTVSVIVDPQSSSRVNSLLSHPAKSREVAGTAWVTGEIGVRGLLKLAGLDGVRLVYSLETFQSTEAPGLDGLRSASLPSQDQLRAAAGVAASGDMAGLEGLLHSIENKPRPANLAGQAAGRGIPSLAGLETAVHTPADVHGAAAAHDLGLRGEGVVVAVVDTGVDFGHPDLAGTQAVVPSGPYAGWAFAYDTLSGYYYAAYEGYSLDPMDHAGRLGYTNYAAALPVGGAECAVGECQAQLLFGAEHLPVVMRWPDTSLSGSYYYTILPDAALIWQSYTSGLGYPQGMFIPPFAVVADESEAGVYDAVYVDINYDSHMDASERLSKQVPAAGADLNGDGIWDVSTGLLAWISDGAHHPPGTALLYPGVASLPVLPAGQLLVFINDMDGHGTSCAGQIAAQGIITDPDRAGPVNPLLGGPVLSGMAPEARIAAFQNGYSLPLDAWTLAALGFDGLPQSGDEAQLVSNSWGSSAEAADGWDEVSRFVHALNLVPDAETGRPLAEQVTFLAATGNGGHGYGTSTAPGGATFLSVGASTLYGNLSVFENVTPDRFLHGEIQPWSNRGPGALGDLAPDISATGAYGTGALPLNLFSSPDGQAAYEVFGGTSMSAPLAAGGGALVYQAFQDQNGRWPTWREARELMQGGAEDLGYEPSLQGAGDLRVDRSAQAALGLTPRLSPAEWPVGSAAPAYAAFLEPGAVEQRSFTLANPTGDFQEAALSAVTLERVHDEAFSIAYVFPEEGYASRYPLYLEDLDSLLAAHPADLVRVQLVLPFSAFDADGDYYNDQWWQVGLYDWTDLDGDGYLWQDANSDGQVQTSELDGTAAGEYAEINRFSFANPAGTVLEASLGSKGLSQVHDGVFLGLSCQYCGESVTLQVRVSLYRTATWDWVRLSAERVSAPAGGQAGFLARLRVPPDAQPGYYEGQVRADLGERTISVPVTLQVAAGGTFELQPDSGSAPYTNANLQGGFNWNWRYEAGDWRTFFFNHPPAPEGQYTRGIVDLNWGSAGSDLDAFVYAPVDDIYSADRPDLFGPTGLAQVAASADAHISAGRFRRKTSTGGPREVLSFEPRAGLNLLALHQVLSGGDQHAEPFSLSVYTLSASAESFHWVDPLAYNPAPALNGSRSLRLSATADIPDGLHLSAYGFSPQIDIPTRAVTQDDSYNVCSVSWLYTQPAGVNPQLQPANGLRGLELRGAGLLEVRTSSSDPRLDVDLIVLRDDGDGRYECGQDPVAYYSSGPGANEILRVNFPSDGAYWIGVQGFAVPGGSGSFDISIRAVQGTALRVRGLPLGPLLAGQVVDLQLDYLQAYPYTSGEVLDAILYAGLPSAPALVEIPITLRPAILLQPAHFTADSSSIFANPVTVRLAFSNRGAVEESVQGTIDLPEGLEYVDGSAAGPGSPPNYDPFTRTLVWNGPAGAGSALELSFAVVANPLFPPGPVEIKAQVEGLSSGQSWSPRLMLRVNQWVLYFPRVGR